MHGRIRTSETPQIRLQRGVGASFWCSSSNSSNLSLAVLEPFLFPQPLSQPPGNPIYNSGLALDTSESPSRTPSPKPENSPLILWQWLIVRDFWSLWTQCLQPGRLSLPALQLSGLEFLMWFPDPRGRCRDPSSSAPARNESCKEPWKWKGRRDFDLGPWGSGGGGGGWVWKSGEGVPKS